MAGCGIPNLFQLILWEMQFSVLFSSSDFPNIEWVLFVIHFNNVSEVYVFVTAYSCSVFPSHLISVWWCFPPSVAVPLVELCEGISICFLARRVSSQRTSSGFSHHIRIYGTFSSVRIITFFSVKDLVFGIF